VLEALARYSQSGRLRVESGGREASLHIEAGRVVHVAGTGRPPEETLGEIASATAGEFSFDGNAVLTEKPNADAVLEAVLRQLSPAVV
jgi:hypothetical protein